MAASDDREPRATKKARTGNDWPVYVAPTIKPTRSANWRDGLREAGPAFAYAEDEVVRVMYDGFAKARYHLLALPAEGSALSEIESVADLRGRHLDALRALHSKIDSVADSLRARVNCDVRVGYHSKPSMRWLHCHIISTDMDSPCLKTKYHWLSFTTDFLISPADVERLLQVDDDDGTALTADLKRRTCLVETTALACHRCHRPQKNMPTLKRHVAACSAAKMP